MTNYEAYEQLSRAFRKHLGLGLDEAVVFTNVIWDRIDAVAHGAEKRDPSALRKALEEVKASKGYEICLFWIYCDALVQAEAS